MKSSTVFLIVTTLAMCCASASAQPRFTLDYYYELSPGEFKAGYTLDNTNGTVACSDVSGEFDWLYGGVIDAEGPNGWTYHYELGHPYWATGQSENYVEAGSSLEGFTMTVSLTTPQVAYGPVMFSSGPQHDIFWEGVTQWLAAAPDVLASDPEDDAGGLGNLDLVQLQAEAFGEDLVITLTINGDIGQADWGKYIISIDADQMFESGGMSEFPDADPPMNNANPWVRNIAIGNPAHRAEYFIGSWVNDGGGLQLWQFTGMGSPQWTEIGTPSMDINAGPISTITYTIPQADLGLTVGQTICMEGFATGGNSYDTANDTVNEPPDDWVWNGVDWQAQATVENSSCVTLTQQPAFVHTGVEDEGGGVYRHDYRLMNYGGSVPLYNVDTDYEYRYGWIEAIPPAGWGWDPLFVPGPMSRWVTTGSECDVESAMEGFSIRAGTPDLYWGGVYMTDVNDVVVAESVTQWPAPTGPLFIHTGTEDLGNGTYRHDYKLSNLAGEVDLRDVDVDYEYRYGWFAVDSPDGTYYYQGPMSRWITDQSDWSVGSEYGNFAIYAGTPELYFGGAYLTDANHVVVAECDTLWPAPDPGPVFRYDGSFEESPGVWLHNYTLDNTEGVEPVYDVDADITYYNAWAEIGAPNGWAVQYIGATTLIWETEAAPCNVGAELGGFYIRAGTPLLHWGGVMFTGTGHIEIAQGSTSWPWPLGDMDCDGSADVFDIGAFVLALTDQGDYALSYPDCDINLADCNMDGVVDVFDIDQFVEIIVGG